MNFRQLAAEWHNGQDSALYAYASTGTILPTLASEIQACLKSAAKTEQIHLTAFYKEIAQ